MTEHTLKTHPNYWDAVKSGEKTFEIRLDDRGFQKGDTLVLQRAFKNSTTNKWQGDDENEIECKISYILTGGQFGIEPGYVILALQEIKCS